MLEFRIERCRNYIRDIISCIEGFEGSEVKIYKPPECPADFLVGFAVNSSSIDVSILASGNTKNPKKITGSIADVVVKVETPVPLLRLIKVQIQKIDIEFTSLLSVVS